MIAHENFKPINGIYKYSGCPHCGQELEYQCSECEKQERDMVDHYLAHRKKRLKMNKQELILERAKLMDWQEALGIVNTSVMLDASRVARQGDFSPEAVAKSAEIQAAWIRIQRG